MSELQSWKVFLFFNRTILYSGQFFPDSGIAWNTLKEILINSSEVKGSQLSLYLYRPAQSILTSGEACIGRAENAKRVGRGSPNPKQTVAKFGDASGTIDSNMLG